MKRKRIENDSLGPRKIDSKRLWGAQTQRSLENFKIGHEIMPKEVIVALGFQKKAAALANMKLGILSNKIGKAITKACDHIINLKFINEFPLKVKNRVNDNAKGGGSFYGKIKLTINTLKYIFILNFSLNKQLWKL